MNSKKILLILLISLIEISGCKKSEKTVVPKLSFEDIGYADIIKQTSKLTYSDIAGATAKGNVLKPGAVIIYKTSQGYYGKLKVLSIESDKSFVIRMLTYTSDGGTKAGKQELHIDLDLWCDLDSGEVMSDNDDAIADFNWRNLNDEINLVSSNNARFYRYSN
ncbi:MAG: hypothetical protein WBP45_14190 [Daejeonella sp.]